MLLLQFKLAGYLLVALALVHVIFPRYFDWETDLRPLQLINRRMMEVHTFYVALTVGLMGALLLYAPEDLLTTPLGHLLCLGMSIFWGTRLVIQFVWYDASLWRGKGFETGVHVGFSLLWGWLGGLFFWVWVWG